MSRVMVFLIHILKFLGGKGIEKSTEPYLGPLQVEQTMAAHYRSNQYSLGATREVIKAPGTK
jgi:hypothetical protein